VLHKEFHDAIRGRSERYREWLDPVPGFDAVAPCDETIPAAAGGQRITSATG
jgi:hypothetical protein